MKTTSFNRRILVTLAIAFLCCFSAKAQDKGDWSLIPHVKSGVAFDFLYFPYDGMFRADAGVDTKYNFNSYLSLLVGIEYEYRKDHSDNPANWAGETGPGHHHYFRVPVCVEFTYKWFYANFGPYLEQSTQPWLTERCHEDFGFGTSTEIGGRIRLSDNSHLRLGLQNQIGFNNVTYHTFYQEKEHWTCKSFIDAMLSVGYEYHF